MLILNILIATSVEVRIITLTLTLDTGSMIENLYHLDSPPNVNNRALITQKMELWQRRLAHISPSVIQEMSSKNVARGLYDTGNVEQFPSSHCSTRKGHRSSIPRKSTTHTSKLLELVHSDVSGAFQTPSP